MPYSFLADVVVLCHFAFVLFAVFGGLLAIRWLKTAWFHVPAAAWAALIEFGGWVCPLTPLENWLRIQGGEMGYSGGFINHYLIPLLYPADLTRQVQVFLGFLVVIINVMIYGYLFMKHAPSGTKR